MNIYWTKKKKKKKKRETLHFGFNGIAQQPAIRYSTQYNDLFSFSLNILLENKLSKLNRCIVDLTKFGFQ